MVSDSCLVKIYETRWRAAQSRSSGPQMYKSPYLIVTRPHQGIVAQVAADVGRNNLTIDAIARHEVFVLPRRSGLRGRSLVAGLSRHAERADEG